MNEFIERYRKSIVGVLNGYDRLRFRGTLRLLAFESGVKRFLWRADVLLKDFKSYVNGVTNGREWLARLLDRAGIGYVRRENCFVHVEDIPAAQALFDQQLRVDWPEQLRKLTDRCHPCHTSITGCWPKLDYYWSVDESEWASDVMFRSPQALAQLYPRLIRHGICTFSSPDAMRFLGRKVPNHGHVRGSFQGEVISDLKHRPEGLRVKHRVAGNSIKMYDKQGSVLRIETTVNDPHDFRVYREKENDHSGRQDWHILRKGVADLHRRAQVSQAANERYLNALATVEDTQSVGELARDVCQRVSSKGRRARALNPLSDEDARLLQAVARGEFAINGFRNRDLRVLLYGSQPVSDKQRRSDAGKTTRKIQLLKAHQLIRRVTGTHRYLLTKRGQTVITALLAVRDASTKILTQAA